MHTQMKRLYEAARELAKIEGQTEVAHALGQSPQTVNNWETRGISKVGALKAQEVWGCSATWVLTGDGGMRLGQPGQQVATLPVTPAPRETWLHRVNAEEAELLELYRGLGKTKQTALIAQAKQLAGKTKGEGLVVSLDDAEHGAHRK